MSKILRRLNTPFRVIPWYLWLATLSVAAWFGRKTLLFAVSIVAFYPIPIPPLFQDEPRSVEEAQLQDLRHFEHVRRNERSMSPALRGVFDARVDEMRARAGEMTEAEFMLELARTQAVIDNGHSNASATAMIRPFSHLPVRTAYFDGELRVMRAMPQQQHLLGLRVTHIGGVPVEDVAARFRDAFGGNDANYRVLAPLLFETPAYLNAVGIAGNDISLRLESIGSGVQEETLSPIVFPEDVKWVIPGDLPLFWHRDTDVWRAIEPRETPLYLRHEDRGYWRQALPEIDGVYLNIRTNLDDDSGQSIRAFVAQSVTELRAEAPSVIIVDLRFNHGGDLTRTHPLMVALSDIVGPNGRIYLLTSPNTFSAAIVSLAFAKERAPDRTIIVGEEIGDRLQFWAEGWRYNLPNSGFGARYATAFYDLQNGCHGLFRCYWGTFDLFPVIVDDLEVDIPAPLTFGAYAAGRDPGLEAILMAEAARGSAE